MRVGTSRDRKLLAENFRTTREMLGLPQPAYARLFEVERALVQELEDGQLPAALDARLLKFLLANFTLQPNGEFIAALMREMQAFYGLDHIFTQPHPLMALFEQILGGDLSRWPWIVDTVRYRCRAISRKRLGSFLLLWADRPDTNEATLRALPQQLTAFISFVEQRAIVLLPALFLFLVIDMARSSNPVVYELQEKLDNREPIGLAIPRRLLVPEMIDKIEIENLRLFAYSQEAGIMREADPRV